MINFSFAINKKLGTDYYKLLFSRYGKITNNKNWEFEIHKQDQIIAEIYIDTTFTGVNHAGPSIRLGLLSYTMCAKIYDIRHFDRQSLNWQK